MNKSSTVNNLYNKLPKTSESIDVWAFSFDIKNSFEDIPNIKIISLQQDPHLAILKTNFLYSGEREEVISKVEEIIENELRYTDNLEVVIEKDDELDFTITFSTYSNSNIVGLVVEFSFKRSVFNPENNSNSLINPQ